MPRHFFVRLSWSCVCIFYFLSCVVLEPNSERKTKNKRGATGLKPLQSPRTTETTHKCKQTPLAPRPLSQGHDIQQPPTQHQPEACVLRILSSQEGLFVVEPTGDQTRFRAGGSHTSSYHDGGNVRMRMGSPDFSGE